MKSSYFKNVILSTSKPLRRHFSGKAVLVRENIAHHIKNGDPVVALESTIITHGMPFPQNYRTAKNVEDIIKSNGATPATVGIIDGELIVGLNDEELQFLSQPTTVHKTSRRDLGFVMSKGLHGGTTVSATMLAANMAGIPIFVTGGIGGVHRGAEKSFDISADLTELGRTPIAVVCAGVKSILDIGLTLEYLETQGVPVITYGKSTFFPSFFTPESTYKSPLHLESIADIANCIYTQQMLKLQSGVLVAVPIPDEDKHAGDKIEIAIQQALMKASDLGIHGKEITPFVLSEVSKMSDGASLVANIHLIENNAKVGTKIAKELSAITKKKKKNGNNKSLLSAGCKSEKKTEVVIKSSNGCTSYKRPVVIGGSVFDIKATADVFDTIAETTNDGNVHVSSGGVARNIAECLARLDCDPLLISAIGEDKQGEMIIHDIEKLNMDTSAMNICKETKTASCSIIANRHGELLMAVGDMNVHDTITYDKISNHEDSIRNASMVVIDANLPEDTIHHVQKLCSKYSVPLWYEPTCVSKCERAFLKNIPTSFQYTSPNALELEKIHSFFIDTSDNTIITERFDDINNLIDICKKYADNLQNIFENMVISLGKHGVLDISRCTDDRNHLQAVHYAPARHDLLPVTVKSVSGAGDSFVGGMVYGLINNYDRDIAIKCGLKSAYTSLLSFDTISKKLKYEEFTEDKINEWAPFQGKII